MAKPNPFLKDNCQRCRLCDAEALRLGEPHCRAPKVPADEATVTGGVCGQLVLI